MSEEIQKTIHDRLKQTERVSARREYIASTRVSPGGYLAALFLASFFAAFLIYLELDTVGIFLFGSAILMIPVLAITDRIGFDGKRIQRTGVLPNLWSTLLGSRKRIKISEIEQIETQAWRALKRGLNVKYR